MKVFNVSIEGMDVSISTNPDSIASFSALGAEASINSQGKCEVKPKVSLEHPLLPFSVDAEGTIGLKYPLIGPIRGSLNFNPVKLFEPFFTKDPYYWYNM